MADFGPFFVTIDHRLTFDDLIRAGRYDRVAPEVELLRPLVERASNRAFLISAKHARHPLPAGGPYRAPARDEDPFLVRRATLAIIDFGHAVDPRTLHAHAEMIGAFPARPEELLSLAASDRPLPDFLRFTAVGGSTDILDGRLPALALSIDGRGKRSLSAERTAPDSLRHSPILLCRR